MDFLKQRSRVFSAINVRVKVFRVKVYLQTKRRQVPFGTFSKPSNPLSHYTVVPPRSDLRRSKPTSWTIGNVNDIDFIKLDGI